MVSFKEGENWIRACFETSLRLQGEATILVRQEMNDLLYSAVVAVGMAQAC